MHDNGEQVKILRACASENGGCQKCPRLNTKGFANDCAMSAVREAADAIEELVAAVPKWISVEERLPQKRCAVLAYCPYNKCIYTAYWDGENWVHFGGGNIEYVSFPVTYWMPLPEPPKEVER